jgi:hypothetical protein
MVTWSHTCSPPGDVDVPVPVLVGGDTGHRVLVVIEDHACGRHQDRPLKAEELVDHGDVSGRVSVAVVPVEDNVDGGTAECGQPDGCRWCTNRTVHP